MNLAKYIDDAFARAISARMAMGTVTGTSGNKITVQMADSAAADAQSYAWLRSPSEDVSVTLDVTAGDEVVLVKLGYPPTWVVIGVVER